MGLHVKANSFYVVDQPLLNFVYSGQGKVCCTVTDILPVWKSEHS